MESPTSKQTPKTQLLFYDTLTLDTSKDRSFDIIDFSPPISLHQIRIIRHSGTIHLPSKPREKSKTQTGPVQNFSVFVQEPDKVAYTLLCKESSFNEKSINDYIIPVSQKNPITLTQIIFRGEYKSITIGNKNLSSFF